MSAFEWLQHKLTRRTAVKGAVVGGAALAGAGMHLAAQDAIAGDWRPLNDAEWDYFFSHAEEPRLIDPPQDADSLLVEEGWYLGDGGWMIEDPAARADVVQWETERLRAWERKDRAWFAQHSPLTIPTDSHLDEASAHYCYYETGTPKVGNGQCYVAWRENRTSTCCGYTCWSCWAAYNCSDGHYPKYCRLCCCPCSM